MTVLATRANVVGHRWALLVALQAAARVRADSARETSIPVIAISTSANAIWRAYGITIANLPLIVTDSVGLCRDLVTLNHHDSPRPTPPSG
jgi:hypothetical protein